MRGAEPAAGSVGRTRGQGDEPTKPPEGENFVEFRLPTEGQICL